MAVMREKVRNRELIPWVDYSPDMPTGHDALAHDLAMWLWVWRHMMTWENMEIQPGSRPDVFSMQGTYRPPFSKTCVYEVKVTRSDFLNEIRTGKWRKYLGYCDKLYLAAPKGLIDLCEVPKGVGLMERAGKHWHFRRGASRLGSGVGPRELIRAAVAAQRMYRRARWGWRG